MGGNQSSVQQTRPTREGAACTEQGDLHRTAHIILFLTTQCVVLTKHTMQFRCSLIVGLFCSMQFGWSPLHFAVYYGHLNIVNQLVNVCRLPPEQKTKVRTGGQGLFACQVQVACPVISACLLNGPSRTDHCECFVVDRPIQIHSTYGGRLSNAQWYLLMQMPIMCGHPKNWIQFAFNPIQDYVWTGLTPVDVIYIGW